MSINTNKTFKVNFIVLLTLTTFSFTSGLKAKDNELKIAELKDVVRQALYVVNYGKKVLYEAENTGEVPTAPISVKPLKVVIPILKAIVDDIKAPDFQEIPKISIKLSDDHHKERKITQRYVIELININSDLKKISIRIINLNNQALLLSRLGKQLRSLQKNIESAISNGASFIPLLRRRLPWLWWDLLNISKEVNLTSNKLKTISKKHKLLLNEQNEALRAAGKMMLDRIELEDKSLSELRETHERLKSDLEKAKELVDKIESNLEKLEKERGIFLRKYQETSNKQNQLNNQLQRAKENLAKANRTVETTTRNLRRSYNLCENGFSYDRCRHHELKKRWNNMRNGWKRDRRQARAEIKRLKINIPSIETNISKVTQEIQKINIALENLKNFIDGLMSEKEEAIISYQTKDQDLRTWVRQQRIDVYSDGIDSNRLLVLTFSGGLE